MKVSVIIPTFNRALLVIETLRSALKQTFLDREIIVVDDGSTDDTRQRLEPFLPEITYVHQQNKGVNAARNHGLSIAKGQYIALLDNDDLWQPFLLELFVAILDSIESVGFVYSNFGLLKSDGTIRHNIISEWYTHNSDFETLFDSSCQLPQSMVDSMEVPELDAARLYLGDIYHASLFHPAVLPSASLYRRCLTAAEQPFNEKDSICGDWEFFANLSKTHGAAFLDFEAAFNRSHDDEVRLMRTDVAVRLQRQIAFVDRTWKADFDFMADFSSDVYAQLQKLFFTLIKVHLVNGNGTAARESVASYRRMRIPHENLNLKLITFVAQLPGIAVLLHRLRMARDIIFRIKRISN